MPYLSVNPHTGKMLQEFPYADSQHISEALAIAADAVPIWRNTAIEDRAYRLHRMADVLRQRRDELATTITLEMGKLLREAQAEIEKCAGCCDYYAEHGATILQDELITSDADSSYVTLQPLGTILAIMPWNFPFWQLFRAAVPALIAGNTIIMKHASSVPKCALAIESVMREAGLPTGVFINLMISATDAQQLLADNRIHAVTFTGSTNAGKAIAATAGQYLKRSLLELGGSDPFIVLDDADINLAINSAMQARFINCGQSCIAAKRFIVQQQQADKFISAISQRISALHSGDPEIEATTLAPMASDSLRHTLHTQISTSVAAGAKLLCGGQLPQETGFYYPATLLTDVAETMPVWLEETFGPVISIMVSDSDQQTIALANNSPYGLGASLFTRSKERGERIARQLHTGMAFVNGVVKSDPRLPFGGIKQSGYGRELSWLGVREFTNAKTVWIKE